MSNLKSSKSWTSDQINDEPTVRQFLTSLIVGDNQRLSFHPDNDLRDFVSTSSGPVNGREESVVREVLVKEGIVSSRDEALLPTNSLPTYSEEDVNRLEECLAKCETIDMGERDVYSISMDIWDVIGLTSSN